MSKIILQNKITKEIIELEGVITSFSNEWEIIKGKKEKNGSSKKKANGEGSLYYSETLEKWIGQYTDQTGKRQTLTQRKNEKVTDFKKKFNAILTSINNGTYIEKSKETLYEILETHIEYKLNTGIISDRTYLREKNTLAILETVCSNFINKPIQSISVKDIQKSLPNFREGEKNVKEHVKTVFYSNNTISKMWIMLKKGFKIAMSDRKILYNPMENENITKPKSKKIDTPVKALTIEEHKKLLDVLLNKTPNHKYTNILLLQLYTGMRIGEVLALSKDCIDIKKGTISVYRTLSRDKNDNVIMGKTTKTFAGSRIFFLSPSALALCKQILSSKLTNIDNLLFYNYEKNTYVTPSQVNCYLKRLNSKYEITDNIHTHMLRHTFATRFIEAGGAVKVLQSILGQTDVNTTLNTYTSVLDDFNREQTNKFIDYLSEIGV